MKSIYRALLLLALVLVGSPARAGMLGTTPQDIAGGISSWAVNSLWHWFCTLFNWLGSLCVQGLLIFFNWIGTLLLYIPDFSNPATYAARNNQAAAFQVVTNVSHIFFWIGFVIVTVTFIIYISRIALGISGADLSMALFIRVLLPLTLLAVWPWFCGHLANASTDISNYIYDQNPFQTQNAWDGLSNFNMPASNSLPTIVTGELGHRQMAYNDLKFTKDMAVAIGYFLCAVAMFMALTKVGTGDPKGWRTFWIACFCIVIISLLPSALIWLGNVIPASLNSAGTPIDANNLASNVLPSTDSTTANIPLDQAAAQPNPQVLPPNAAPTPVNPPAGSAIPLPDQVNPVADTWQNVIGDFLRAFISIWGLFICLGVVIAKCYQLLSIFVLFLLGYAFIGFLGNPSTQNIFFSGLKLFLKLHLYGPIWALALLVFNLSIHIVIGPPGAGVSAGGNILEAFMIIAALMIIQNTSEFANIFSEAKWAGSEMGKEAMAAMRTGSQMLTAGASLATAAPTQHALAAAANFAPAGSAIGSALKNAAVGANAVHAVANSLGGPGSHSVSDLFKPGGLGPGAGGKGLSDVLGSGPSAGSGGSSSGGGSGPVALGSSNFTPGGWPTNQGYSAINKALGTNFSPPASGSNLDFAKADAAFRSSITDGAPGSPAEWTDSPQQGYSQQRWNDILNNYQAGPSGPVLKPGPINPNPPPPGSNLPS